MVKKRHEVSLHICGGCGKCNYRDGDLEDLIRECVKFPERFKEGVYARPEVLKALEEEERARRGF